MLEIQRKQEEDRRIEEHKKEEADCWMAGLVHDRVQIAEDLSRDLKKVTPPTFNGKTTGEEVEAWIATMEKYFHVRNFTGKSRAVWATFQLVGEAATWWDNVMAEKKLQHGEISWEDFMLCFRK